MPDNGGFLEILKFGAVHFEDLLANGVFMGLAVEFRQEGGNSHARQRLAGISQQLSDVRPRPFDGFSLAVFKNNP